jgi:hypothetical protein
MRMRRLRILTLVAFITSLGFASLPTPVDAQTPYVPYFGKNRVRYDQFEWHIYKTDHFDIFYYPELEPHLERAASYAESAYQRISADLKHDLADRVPLILFKTQSEFQTNNIAGELPEGVLAFAEPERRRMVMPIDEPPDQLYRLIVHELTHVFEFDIIPRGLMGGGIPLWVDEGLANYMAGYWNPVDLMQVRDAALTDNVPRMSRFESQPLSGRLPYSMGHAAFEFIEERWGKEGLRQFLFSLRKNVLGSGETAYQEALKIEPEEFDDQFDRYLKERFKPFRDKERPADYGRDISPSAEYTPYVMVLSIEPSPSGDMLAVVAGNRKDQELDIVLVSAYDGQFIRNVTSGFDQERGFEYIGTAGGLRGNLVPWIAWAPVGDRIAFFGRSGKGKDLIVQNIVTGRIEYRVELNDVDAPESPAFSPDGRQVAFSAIAGGITDVYIVDLATESRRNVTADATADYAPAFAPDGQSIVYTARIGGNDKLFRLNLNTNEREQLTFGSHDDTAAKFVDANTLVFTSTAIDPAAPVSLEVARNGNVPNVWTLNLQTRELRQWTDAMTGAVSPVVLRQEGALRVAFVSYYKGMNGIHAITADAPVATVASADFGAPGPIFDFTAPISHTLQPDNIHKKGPWERMMLAGRPPLNLGITSSNTFYGNTQVTFTDLLGDKEVSFYAQSIAQHRTMALTYVNTERRTQYALQAFTSDTFYYGQDISNSGALYDPRIGPFISRDLAESSQGQRGATLFAIYPLNRYSRFEVYSGYIYMTEGYLNDSLQEQAIAYQIEQYGQPVFRNGHSIPAGFSWINESTIFREFGPVAGRTVKLSYFGSPPLGDRFISRTSFDADVRQYLRIGSTGVFASRFKGFRSWGNNPDFTYFGGNSEMRGYEYLQFMGNQGFFLNAELRFPLIEAMLTPIGVLGGLRGTFFFNMGGSGYSTTPFNFGTWQSEVIQPIVGYNVLPDESLQPVYGDPLSLSGPRLIDGRASYGFGLSSMALGFPMHFDFSWKTLFDKTYEDATFRSCFQTTATSYSCVPVAEEWRNMKFDFWIGFDF